MSLSIAGTFEQWAGQTSRFREGQKQKKPLFRTRKYHDPVIAESDIPDANAPVTMTLSGQQCVLRDGVWHIGAFDVEWVAVSDARGDVMGCFVLWRPCMPCGSHSGW